MCMYIAWVWPGRAQREGASQKAAAAGSAISAVDGHDTLLATFEATEKAVDVAFRKRKPITFRMAPFY